MSSPVLIQYLRLDSGGDPNLDPTTALVNAAAVAQAVETRLRLFLGEWWENVKLGLPVFQVMLGQLATPTTLAATRSAVQQNIAGAPYVVAVNGVTTTYEAVRLTVTASYISQFGPATSTATLPGLSAAVGS